MVDPSSAVNVCSQNFLEKLQDNDITIPLLEEPTFHIIAYDSSSKKLLGLVTRIVTLGLRIAQANFML